MPLIEYTILVMTAHTRKKVKCLSSSAKLAEDSVRARLGLDMKHARVEIDTQTDLSLYDNSG